MLALVLAVLVGVAIAVASSTTPFRPTRAAAPLRLSATAVTAVAGVMLVVSSTFDWWASWRLEGASATVVGHEHLVVRWVVVAGLVSCAVTIAAAWGRRNWAPLALLVAWLGVAVAWYESSGEVTGVPTEARLGLRLATWAVLLVTLAAALASISRTAER